MKKHHVTIESKSTRDRKAPVFSKWSCSCGAHGRHGWVPNAQAHAEADAHLEAA